MIKTSEYVSPGHPDKMCDYISSYILDRLLEVDAKTRFALEVQAKDLTVNLAGEITTRAFPDELAAKIGQWTRDASGRTRNRRRPTLGYSNMCRSAGR